MMNQHKKHILTSQLMQEYDTKINAQYILIGVIIAILCWTFISFYPSVENGFVNWDDQVYVYQSKLIQQKSIPFKEIFTSPISNNYHPLTMLSLSINYQISGLKPGFYHWTNLILHLFNTFFVFVFIYLLSDRRLAVAAIVSLFFGIHPMHVESVAWISERKDVLYTFFYLSALIVYLKYLEKQNVLLYIGVFILFVFSCLSKGVAVTLPLVMFLIDYLLERKYTWKVVLEKIPFFIIAILFGIIAIKTQADVIVTMKVFTIPHRIIFASYDFIMYIAKMVVPANLSSFYTYPFSNIKFPIIFYLAPFIVIAILLLGLWSLRKTRKVVFGLLFYFISIILVIQFFSVGSELMADRYTYMSYIGLFFVVGSGYDYLLQQKTSLNNALKNFAGIALIAYAVILSVITYNQTQVWKNGETLWSNVINKDPSIFIAYTNRMEVRMKSGDFRGVIEDGNSALKLDTLLSYSVYDNRANAKYYLEDYKGALADVNVSLRLHPGNAQMYFKRGLYKEKLQDYRGAVEDYNKVIEMDSTNYDTYINRAQLKYLLFDYAGSISDLDKAMMIKPGNYNIFAVRGTVKGNSGDFEGAIKDFGHGLNQVNLYFCKKIFHGTLSNS